MKKMRNFMVVMAVMMVLVVALSDKITLARDHVIGKILNNKVEEVETEETKELDGVILFTKNGNFLVYQIIFTDGSIVAANDLAMLVNVLNDKTDKTYVQTETGKVQEVDTIELTVRDIKMAHAETKDLW
jgi:hypothetical protein